MGFVWPWNRSKDLDANSAESKWPLPNGRRKYGVSFTPFFGLFGSGGTFSKWKVLKDFPGGTFGMRPQDSSGLILGQV